MIDALAVCVVVALVHWVGYVNGREAEAHKQEQGRRFTFTNNEDGDE